MSALLLIGLTSILGSQHWGSGPQTEATGTALAVAVSTGASHTCVLRSGGGVRCWGFNGTGQLGDGTTTSRATAGDASGLTSHVSDVSAGYFHTCAVASNGAAKCWGSGQWGQLGDGTSADSRTAPVDVCASAGCLSSLTGITSIVAGGRQTCAVTSGGGVKCWGHNVYGEVGDGQSCGSDYCTTPADVAGLTTGVASVVAGFEHSCALTTTGGVKCWGDNAFGELGAVTSTGCPLPCSTTPVDVPGLTSGVTAIAAGAHNTCALIAGGVKCWGYNGDGALGDGRACGTYYCAEPVNVSNLGSGVAAIATGLASCAVMTAGDVKCWGDNAFGEAGDGSTTDRYAPVDACATGATAPCSAASGNNLTGVTAVSSGLTTCALTTGGGVKCWGYNASGQLGNGTSTGPQLCDSPPRPCSTTPVDVVGLAGGGDVNCSGGVDPIDAALILQLSAGLIASLPCSRAADVNGDSSANAIDAALILQYVAGLTSKP